MVGFVALLTLFAPVTRAQPEAACPDPVQCLRQQLQSGEAQLGRADAVWGYLPSLLKALDVPAESQVLVFSKTSLQVDEIGPKTPRAIYFNDDTVVAGVQGGRITEILTSGADGQIAFYSVEAAPTARPQIDPESSTCMGCHGSVNRWAGGMIVANFTILDDGAPLIMRVDRLFDITDSTTPFDQRWGGWYVTGKHGALRHNGNVRLPPGSLEGPDTTDGLNVTDLSSRFDVTPYLAPTSDIVALMTLEHQLGATNRIWKLQAQQHYPLADGVKPATAADIDESIEDLVAYLVGAHEAPLSSAVTGVSGFTKTFETRGPRDGRGRSLRDFDLRTRLFRYPLSYTIYSRAFDRLSPALRQRIYARLVEVLSGADKSELYAGLPLEGRRAALEILNATKPDFRAVQMRLTASPAP